MFVCLCGYGILDVGRTWVDNGIVDSYISYVYLSVPVSRAVEIYGYGVRMTKRIPTHPPVPSRRFNQSRTMSEACDGLGGLCNAVWPDGERDCCT